MNIIIDRGNSYFKLGLFQNDKLIEKFRFSEEKELITEIETLNYDHAILCSVGKHSELLEGLEKLTMFSDSNLVPISNKYKTPHTLGLDRLAAVIGASVLFKNQEVLVIDSGSCITYDFLNIDKEYLGGGISPGIAMKFKALNNFTAKLPLVSLNHFVELIGDTTETSIQSGVINGTIAEISGIIQKYQNISDNLAPVLCGGDSQFIAERLEETVRVEEDLVLYGLNEVIKFNE